MPDPAIFLLPGEIAWQREPSTITTLLGSCVAVCLHDRGRRAGGMNHIMMPEAALAPGMPPGKIAPTAIAGLLRLAAMAGSGPGDLVAELHGGGAVVGHLGASGDIGTRNLDAARAALRAAGIAIRHEAVGGTRGRRVVMRTGSGEIESAVLAEPGAAPAGQRRCRVLVIDDSATVRGLLRAVIGGDPRFQVAGEAEDPFQARERILQLDPDVLCLDLIMPGLDGLTFLQRLMQYRPIPTVVVSTIAKPGSAMHAKVMAAGAVAALDKEALALYQGMDVARRALLPVLAQAAARAGIRTGAPG